MLPSGRVGCCSWASRESGRRRSGRRSSRRPRDAASACSSRARPRRRRSSRSPFSPTSSRRVEDATLAELPGVAARCARAGARRRGESGSTVDPVAVALAVLGVLRRSVGLRPGGRRGRRPPVGGRAEPARAHVRVPPARRRARRAGRDRARRVRARADAARRTRRELASTGSRSAGSGRGISRELVFERTGRTLSPPQLERAGAALRWKPVLRARARRDRDPSCRAETLAVALRARLATLSDGGAGGRSRRRDARAIRRGVDRRSHGASSTSCARPAIVDERAGQRCGSRIRCSPRRCSTCTRPRSGALVHLARWPALEDPDERALHLGRGTEAASEAVAAELESARRPARRARCAGDGGGAGGAGRRADARGRRRGERRGACSGGRSLPGGG